MLTCQNCGYELILLERRLKYKCALCSRLFSQKQVDNETFKIWNQKQRELDIHNYELEFKKKQSQINELKKSLKQMFKPSHKNNKEQEKLWRAKNREKMQAREREYYEINKDKINAKRREKWKLNSEQFNKLKNASRNKNKALTRLQSRIDYWKQQQKTLADSMLKFKEERTYTDILAHSVPTFVLCEQLTQ